MRNINYMLTVLLYPFILILSYFLLTNFVKGSFYIYLVVLMIIIYIPLFIMSLYHACEEIFKSKRKWRIVLLILFPLFYLPFYYTRYVNKDENVLGFVLCLFSLTFSILTLNAFNKRLYEYLNSAFKNYAVVNENYVYISSNKLFTVNVSKDFRCSDKDIGDYAISCDKLDDDSFIGIYSYDITGFSDSEIEDIFAYHLGQSLEYVNENEYEAEIDKSDDIVKIYYNNMVILLSQQNYIVGDRTYSLVIIKEMPKELEDLEKYQEMIATIYFLNYNENVSS